MKLLQKAWVDKLAGEIYNQLKPELLGEKI